MILHAAETLYGLRERWGRAAGGWRDARASEQQNVLSAHYMPAGISSLSEDRPPFVIKQRTNPVMEQRWAH